MQRLLPALLAGTMLVACSRDSQRCESNDDCFAGESCDDGACAAPPIEVEGVPASPGVVGEFTQSVSFRLVLDERNEPHFFLLMEDGELVHRTWDGFGWASRAIGDNLVLGPLSVIEAEFDSAVGFTVIGSDEEGLHAFTSTDGLEFERETLLAGSVFAPSMGAGAGITAICVFPGDLTDLDSLVPLLLIRDGSGTWTEYPFDEPATPFCSVDVSKRGVLTAAFARYDDDFGEQVQLVQTLATVPMAVDTTTFPTTLPGRLVSADSLDVIDGTAVLFHGERSVTAEDLFITRVHDVDRWSTTYVRSISLDRFFNNSDLFIDPLDERRVVLYSDDFTTTGSNGSGVVGELRGDFLDLRPLEDLADADTGVQFAMGSDGVVRIGTLDGVLRFEIGL